MKKLLTILFFFWGMHFFAQIPSLEFVENKGQWYENVQFKANLPSGNLYLEANELTYQFFKHEDMVRYDEIHHGHLKNPTDDDFLVNAHSFKVRFLNAEKVIVKGEGKTTSYENYFIGNDTTKWASGVKKFRQAIYPDLYSKIDLKLYSKGIFLKYDFIVRKGGDVSQIQFDYVGVENVSLENGKLKVQTSVNEMVEQRPYAYQMINGKIKVVKCRFKLDGTKVTFEFPRGYNKNHTLVIDPLLVFASYSGSTFDNWGYTSTFDNDGHLYGGGVTFGVGYPTTTGAYQINFNGGNTFYSSDITITKFSSDGSSLIYATYLGGTLGNECPHSLIVNNAGELVILGTTSSPDYPVTSSAFDTSFGGGAPYFDVVPGYIDGSDIIVSKLSATGTVLTGSTYFGGSSNDGLNLGTALNYNYADEFRGELIVDQSDNVYVASSTSSSDIQITPGAFQSTNNGLQDGVVFKLSPGLTNLEWSSYIGGSGHDAVYSLVINTLGELVLTGGTESNDFPIVPNGIISTYQQGVSDGWIAKLNATGTTILSSTFLGTTEYDQAYFVDTDYDDNIYVVGQTEGSYPIYPQTVYNDSNSGQFLHKLSPNLDSTIFSTTFGSSSGEIDIALSAFLVNECNYIFVSGWGGRTNVDNAGPPFSSTNGLIVTPNAIQGTTDGSDYYLVMFSENVDSVKYATFFGGDGSNDHVDGGTSRFDKKGIVYQSVCASCGAEFDDFPTTPGAFSEATDPTVNCNLGVFKMDLSVLTAEADVYTTPFHCIQDSVRFRNRSNGGISQVWNFGDGDTSSLFEPTHIYDSAGTYNVQLIVKDPVSCSLSDTAYVEVFIGSPPTAIIDPISGICRGDSIRLSASGGQSYQWLPNYNILDADTDTALVWPDSTTIYSLIVSDSCGLDTVNIEVVVFQNNVSISQDTMICIGQSVPLFIDGAISAVWTPSDGLNNSTSLNPIASPIINTSYSVSIIDSNACQYDTTVMVMVDTILPDVFGVIDQQVCLGDSVKIYTLGTAVINYEWLPSNTLITPNDSITWAKPKQTTRYVVEGVNGCSSDYDTLEVVVNQPELVTSGDLVVCKADSFEIWATGGVSYLWSVYGDILSDASRFVTTVIQPTLFFVEMEDVNGCSDTSSVFVDVLDNPYLDLDATIQTSWGNKITLQASTDATIFQWSPIEGLSCETCFNPQVILPEIRKFYLTVTNSEGCKANDSIRISYDGVIYVPNSFTPNADGDNDTFKAYGEGIISFTMSIYNRWGELLFYSENIKNFWDGTYKGELVKTEAYVWKIKYKEVNGKEQNLYGKVSLIR